MHDRPDSPQMPWEALGAPASARRPSRRLNGRPRGNLRSVFALAAALAVALPGSGVVAQEPADEGLARRGYLVRSLGPRDDGGGALIRTVGAGSAAEAAGLREGDVLLSIGGVELERWWRAGALARRFRAGSTVEVVALRNADTLRSEVSVPALPIETLDGTRVSLHAVETPSGYAVRAVLTAPEGRRAPHPAVVLAPWLSCDSVESPFGPGGDGMMRLLHRVAEASGWATLRVDRPGVGDSEGPPCGELDFREELDAYRAAVDWLRSRSDVDADRIVVLGLSNGGGYGPLLLAPDAAAGYVAVGGWSGTWLEHMLDHERVRMGLTGTPPGRVNAAMRSWATFYDRFLNGKRTPGEVLEEHPGLEELWYGEPDGLYGRSAAFHHQLQELNLDAAWAAADVPVLAVWGSADWIMSRRGHERIVELARGAGSPRARLEVVEGMDHFLMIHPSMQASFDGEEGRFAEEAVELVLDFLEGAERRDGA